MKPARGLTNQRAGRQISLVGVSGLLQPVLYLVVGDHALLEHVSASLLGADHLDDLAP